MRKILGIIFSAMLLLPAIKISIDRHYCGGHLAGVKMSISGKLATCGMENEGQSPADTPVFTVKCCEDQLTVISTDYRYYPVNQNNLNLKISTDIPAEKFSLKSSLWISPAETDLRFLPPGRYIPRGPEQAEICLFRI